MGILLFFIYLNHKSNFSHDSKSVQVTTSETNQYVTIHRNKDRPGGKPMTVIRYKSYKRVHQWNTRELFQRDLTILRSNSIGTDDERRHFSGYDDEVVKDDYDVKIRLQAENNQSSLIYSPMSDALVEQIESKIRRQKRLMRRSNYKRKGVSFRSRRICRDLQTNFSLDEVYKLLLLSMKRTPSSTPSCSLPATTFVTCTSGGFST